MKRKVAVLLLLAVLACAGQLKLEDIMKESDFIGYTPHSVRWSPDSRIIYFVWKKSGREGIFAFDTSKKKLYLVEGKELGKVPPPAGEFSPDGRKILYERGGDIYIYDLKRMKTKRITATSAVERSPFWSKRYRDSIYYLCKENLFRLNLRQATIEQVTNFVKRGPSRTEPLSEFDKWLASQQRQLFPNLFKGPSFRLGPWGRLRSKLPPKVKIKKKERVVQISLSPDERFALVLLSQWRRRGKPSKVAHYVTRSGYMEVEEARPKAGAGTPFGARALLLELETGKTFKVQLPDERARILRASFLPSGYAVVSAFIPHHDLYIYRINREGKIAKILFHLHDPAWVNMRALSYRVCPDGRRIALVAEIDGHLRLITVNMNGELKVLTRGDYEVFDFSISPDRKGFIYHSNEGHPGKMDAYFISFDGRRKKKLTSMKGRSRAWLSPDGKKLAVLNSTPVRPPELFYVDPSGKAYRITDSPSPEFKKLTLREPEIVSYPASDGVKIYARLFRPDPAKKNGAAVIFIHGAGYLQHAHYGWSSYYWHEFLFHNFLVQKGYTVIAPDYRGSAGYGRAFRTAIYGHMGGRDLEDIVDTVRYLVKEVKIDPERIGVYGGSYGGFLTLMAMFKHPELFACGAALRPVTDWAHYHPYYTNPILGGTPQEVPENYRRSSPIYFAEGQRKPLLILHGMIDNNVLFQDSVRLAERLIELRKKNWWLVGYPLERHSFRFAESWYDEYRRIYELFEKYLSK